MEQMQCLNTVRDGAEVHLEFEHSISQTFLLSFHVSSLIGSEQKLWKSLW